VEQRAREKLAKQAHKNAAKAERRVERAVAAGGVAKKHKKKAFRIRKGVQIKARRGAGLAACVWGPRAAVSGFGGPPLAPAASRTHQAPSSLRLPSQYSLHHLVSLPGHPARDPRRA
jgi:hypothetical protein